MRKLFYYGKIGYGLVKKYSFLLWTVLISGLGMFFNIICCFFLLRKKESVCNLRMLSDYYPDCGKLSSDRVENNTNYNVTLSIIVPVFNAVNYICECIDSILSQITEYSFEVILIDDGSTDSTVEVLQKYLNSAKINLFFQKNAGQSSARNNGIMHSSGKYIMFVDADDILLPGAIQIMVQTAENTNSEIVEGSITRFYKDITEEMIEDSKGISYIESYKKNPNFVLTTYGYSWAKVYKRELWESLRFPEGYIFEDVITKFILRRKANQVAFVGDVVYGYRMSNPNSSSHSSNQMKKIDSIWVLPKIYELCNQENVPRDDVFYFLSLNHIGILNYITTKPHTVEIKSACFAEMRKQLLSIQDCRPKKMPMMFKMLDKAILENKFEAWELIAKTIQKYHMLKKWREIN